jgi:hypothetical protein
MREAIKEKKLKLPANITTKEIFMNIEIIAKFHELLLSDLKTLFKDRNDPTKIGTVFSELVLIFFCFFLILKNMFLVTSFENVYYLLPRI